MEESARFIPLGVGQSAGRGRRRKNSVLDESRISDKTPAERKEIARKIRLAAKREKKQIKADAKRQRKQNAIMHRRMTRNNEKYRKNEDRNKQRAIDFERQKIRYDAVRQAEKLAAIHDPSGRMFNVGEVVIMPDGKVKSKAAIQRAAEAREHREIKKEETERIAIEKAKYKEEKLQAKREGREPPPRPDFMATINLQNAASDYGPGQTANSTQQMVLPPKPGLNPGKTERQRQELLKAKPILSKPIIPEGVSLPVGEENLLELWDITDEQIQQRLNSKKKVKVAAAKHLRKIQKGQKKFNRALKVRKKQAAKLGILWDPEKAKKEILGEIEQADWDVDASGSNSDSGSDSDAGSGEEKDMAKKKNRKLMPQVNRPRLDLDLLEQASKLKEDQDLKKRSAKLRRREERREAKAREAANDAAKLIEIQKEAEQATHIERFEETSSADKSSKKRKRSSKEHANENSKKVKTDNAELEEERQRKLEKRQRKEQRRQEREAKESDTVRKPQIYDVQVNRIGEEAPKRLVKEEKAQGNEEWQADKSDALTKAESIGPSKDDKLNELIAERHAQMKAGANEDIETEEEPQYATITQSTAQQWNPDALQGDEARKAKFLKLLGARKQNEKPRKTGQKETTHKTVGEIEVEGGQKVDKETVKANREEYKARKQAKKEKRSLRKTEESVVEKRDLLAKMQSDLEKQFEAGIKLKHDGGNKRLGLGA